MPSISQWLAQEGSMNDDQVMIEQRRHAWKLGLYLSHEPAWIFTMKIVGRGWIRTLLKHIT